MTKNKLICRLVGGLGNQLFSYAAAKRLAKVNNAELVLDQVSGFKYDKTYKRSYQLDHFNISAKLATRQERLEPFSKVRRYILKKNARMVDFLARKYITQDKIEFDKRLLDLRFSGTVFIEGYWQSEKYFKDIAQDIKNEFRIDQPQDIKNTQIKNVIANSGISVALHFRDFNGLTNTTENLDPDYYTKAIKHIFDYTDDPTFVVFSDNIELAKSSLKIQSSKVVYVNHNNSDDLAFCDMYLMKSCTHTIIANSSFSWWGAWLNPNPYKIIIAPSLVKKTGVSSWGFDGLIPNEWILI